MVQQRLDRIAPRAIAPCKRPEGLGMGEVQPALAGQQEFAAHRGHAVVKIDLRAAACEHFGRHETRRTAADDSNRQLFFFLFWNQI